MKPGRLSSLDRDITERPMVLRHPASVDAYDQRPYRKPWLVAWRSAGDGSLRTTRRRTHAAALAQANEAARRNRQIRDASQRDYGLASGRAR